MSLTKQRPSPLSDWFDADALLPNTLHATPIFLIRSAQIGTIQGHTYGQAGITINTTGTALPHLGDSHTMSNTGYNRSHHKQPSLRDQPSPPLSTIAPDDGSIAQHVTTECAPSEYKDRDHAWFAPGRLFKIFSPQVPELHCKEFVLLDTKNKEGPSLLIRDYTEDEETSRGGHFLRSHVMVQNYQSPDQRGTSHKCKAVYMDEYEEHGPTDSAWIELEYLYSITFAEYKYADCGNLDPNSLHDLRQYYVDWLKYHWRLG